jgi:hypothetical protein
MLKHPYYIDPMPIKFKFEKSFGVIPEIASEGMKQLNTYQSYLKSNSTKTKTSIALIFYKLNYLYKTHNITCKKISSTSNF